MGIGYWVALLVLSALGVQGVVVVGADSGESKTEGQIDRDVRDLIRGLENELAAANRRRLALQTRRPVSFAEARLLRVLRIVAVAGLMLMATAIAILWTSNPVLAMASIPVAPVALLGLVLGCEQIVTRGDRYSERYAV